MRSLLLGTAIAVGLTSYCYAADMAVKAPPPPPPPTYSWTSCYIGGNVGGAWDNISTVRTGVLGVPLPPGTDEYYGADNGNAFVGGGQIGCDYQAGMWIFGVQGQYDWGKINSSHNILPFPIYTYNSEVRNFGTLTGRVGYLVTPQTLLYVKAGGAWAHDFVTVTIPSEAFLSESASPNFAGWTVGGGLEWMLKSYLSFFVEYNYMDFGTNAVTFISGPAAVDPGAVGDIINHTQKVSTVLAGFNIRCCGGVQAASK
jgi:outer membrane immunogenic protein